MNKDINILKPFSGIHKTRPLWGFDIETHTNKNKFVMGSIIGDFNVKKVFWDKYKFVEYLKANGTMFSKGYITATNLTFDSLSLMKDTNIFTSMRPYIRGSNMIYLKVPISELKENKFTKQIYTHRALKFIDTFSFVPFSVKKLGEIVGLKKLPNPKFLGKKPKGDKQKLELEKYNLRDSEITYKAIKFIQNGFNSLGGNMRITVASSSMDLFRRKFLKRDLLQPDRPILEDLFKAYYGGRTEIIKRGLYRNVNYYDVNSLYPSVMINKYPDPNSIKIYNRCSKDIINDFEGVANVEITAPYQYLPYLPYRCNKLLFPTGEIKGRWYTFLELRKAVKLGYKIKKIIKAYVFEKTFFPFKEYVEKLYALRKQQIKDNDPMELITKLSLNSLYGKFAQKIDFREEILHKTQVSKEKYESTDDVRINGDFMIFNTPYKHIPKFVNPIFSIYTTAYARDILYDLINKDCKKTYYYDTDSLITKKELDTSLKLGDLKKEYSIRRGVFVKPKMYMLNDRAKCKGVHRISTDIFKDLLNKKRVKIRRFTKFKESNNRNLAYNQIIEFYKEIGLNDDKRVWNGDFNQDILENSEPLPI